MKFKIRFADQIVGILAIAAVIALVFVIFMLGSKQRWFARDYRFTASFETASGLSAGMPLQYKGFTVGKIASVSLNEEDGVDVSFTVYDTYYSRLREGSVIELIVNPIGLGNQFLLHPGNGEGLIAEGSEIPRLDSPEGRALADSGRVTIPKRDDTVSNIVAQVNPLLTNVNETLSSLNGALKGTGKGPLAETMTGVARTVTNVADISGEVSGSMEEILSDLRLTLGQVEATMANLKTLSDSLQTVDGLVPRLIDPDGTMFASLGASLKEVEGTLGNVEDSSSILKSHRGPPHRPREGTGRARGPEEQPHPQERRARAGSNRYLRDQFPEHRILRRGREGL